MKKPIGKIVMLLENSYPEDTRVKNEATLLVSAGYEVTVFCLGATEKPRSERIDGVRVYRVPRIEIFKKTNSKGTTPCKRALQAAKILIGYCVEYIYFTLACFVACVFIYFRHGLDFIHAHNPPDSLFIVAIPFRLLGKKYIFDHHDLCPELFRSRFNAGNMLQVKVLRAVEWFALKLANVSIATNESYKNVHITRGGRRPEAIFVVRNGPDAGRMHIGVPSARLRSMGKSILIYIGSLNPQDGVDYLLRSLRYLKFDLERSDFFCMIMGAGDSLTELRVLANELELGDCVEFTGYVSDEELKSNLAAADICLDPDPSSPLNDVSTWIKIMEYMAAAKPIVAFDLTETRISAREAAVYVRPNDEGAFAAEIAALMDDPSRRKSMGDFGRKRVVEELQWSIVGQNLLRAYEYLRPTGRKWPSDPEKQTSVSGIEHKNSSGRSDVSDIQSARS